MTVKDIQDLVELNATAKEIYPLVVKLCESVLKHTSYNGQYMCPGFVSAYGIPVSNGKLPVKLYIYQHALIAPNQTWSCLLSLW